MGQSVPKPSPRKYLVSPTYMHIDNLSVTFRPAHNSRYNNQLVFADEIPYASLIVAIVGDGVEIELQRGGELGKA